MNLWEELFTNNPMLAEISQYRRRMLSTRGGGANIAIIALIVAFYLLILFAIVISAKDVDAIWIILAQTVVMALLLPVMTAGAIAGERERRTWEILLTVPVTKAQIVAGKYLAGLAGLGVYLLAFFPPVLICVLSNNHAMPARIFASELLSVAFGVFLVGMSILASARSRTTFGAIGACMGFVFIAYLALPIFLFQLLDPSSPNHWVTASNPVATMAMMGQTDNPWWNAHFWNASGWQIAIYLIAAIALAIETTRTVRKQEEIRNMTPEASGKRGKAHA